MNAKLIAFYMHDLSGGGVERMRLSLIEELCSRGLHVVLIVGRLTGSLVCNLPPSLQVIELGCPRTIRSILPLARVVQRLKPNILVSSLDHNNLAAIMAAKMARVQTRVVICQHNVLSSESALGWKYRAVPWLYWLLCRWAHGIIAVSDGVADDFARTAAVSRSRIARIYNPVIGRDFAARRDGAIQHLWFENAPLNTFIFVGRLTEQKNPHLLLQAFSLLDNVLEARLIVLGEGPLLPVLRHQAEQLKITDRVLFAGFQANPLPWIRQSSCLVLTSRYEGFGNVLIEALACGTPVVATDCPHGPREALDNGAFGALTPCGNPERLANAMAQAVLQPRDPDRLRQRAASFTTTACADAHLALFEKLEADHAERARPFGLTFTNLSAAGVVETVLGQSVKDTLRLVVTPNIDHIRLMRQNVFSAAYGSADLVCPDGFPVLAYARFRGLVLRARVTGCDVFKCLADNPEFAAKRIAVVVESRSTEIAARAWSHARGLINLCIITAPALLAADETAQIVLADSIHAARPDILVMTLGAPVSETFIHQHRQELPPCWALCVGQAFRVYLGLTQRAPGSWQKLGLEWLWRIKQEPRRLSGRYARSGLWFGFAVLRDIFRPT
jgi:exopolysaccharide biosynthesis WecB/TagA/CpsF family protein